MDKIAWTWNRKARRVEIVAPSGDALVVEWPPQELGELKAFEYALERAVAVYEILERARQAFESAKGEYSDAATQVGHLIDRINDAAARVNAICVEQAMKFYDGAEIVKAFQGAADEFLRFWREWIEEQRHTRGLRKNSSRARSGKSRRARPETAQNARRPSSETKESSSVSAKSGNGSPSRIAADAGSS